MNMKLIRKEGRKFIIFICFKKIYFSSLFFTQYWREEGVSSADLFGIPLSDKVLSCGHLTYCYI